METKDRILHSAAALFMRNGIKSVSMDDIAAHLAMSKKTLYKWFENKDQIVVGVMQQHLTEEEGDCCQIAESAENALDELFKLMDWGQQMMADIHPSIFYDLQKYYPQAWQLWLAHKEHFILHRIIDNLRRGMAEGLYRADLDVDVLARLRLNQIDLALNPSVFPTRQFNPQQVDLICLEHFMLGVATLKGHKLINRFRHVTEEE